MSGQGHTAECRKRLEDVMMTDASTATRVTRVRQTERIIKDLDDSGAATPAVRVDLVNTNAFVSQTKSTWTRNMKGTQKMQTGGQKALVTRKRSAETDAERLEEESAETAEADSDKRIALKRKAERPQRLGSRGFHDEFACGIVAQGR